MSTTAAPGSRTGPGATRRSFAAWRAQRPFWGAAVALIGAVELYSVTRAPMAVVVMQGLPGLATLFISALTIILAVLTLAQPHLRQIIGWVIIVMGVLSVLVSNLGGFVVGMALMITGGALLLAWEPADVDLDTVPSVPVAPGAATTGVTGPATAPRPKDPRPGTRPQPGRGASGGLLDAMLGRRPARRPVRRTPPPGRRPAPSGKRPPAAGSSPDAASGDIGEGSGSGASGASVQGGLLPPRSTDARARTWILVPLLAISLATTTAVAGPAGAAGGAQRGDSIWDLLFPPPPTTPPPAPGPTAPPPPAPAPASATTAPGVPGLFPGLFPTPSASATPSLPPADCSRAAYPESMPGMGSQGALEAAAAVRSCAAAAADAPVRTASAADGTPTVSREVSTLKATSLTMNGLSYDGVTTLDSAGGPVQVLVFSLDTLDVAGMAQTYPFGGGSRSVSILNTNGDAHITGNVKLYVTKLTGSVFGLVELTFTPQAPPPLIVPFLVMTNATSEVALVQADQVRASSLRSTVG